jgi:hypothetical protein
MLEIQCTFQTLVEQVKGGDHYTLLLEQHNPKVREARKRYSFIVDFAISAFALQQDMFQ